MYAGLAAFFWSLIGPFTKECLAEGVTAMETAFWRAFLGLCCFGAQTALAGGLRIPARHAMVLLLFGVAVIGTLFSSYQIAVKESGAAMAMVLFYTSPAWVAVYSRFLFKERISRRKLYAIGIVLAGTLMVCFSGGSLPTAPSALGIFCGLLSGMVFATQFPINVWWNATYSTSTIYTYLLLGGVVILLPFTEFMPDKSAYAWFNLLALGVLTNYVAYACLARSLQRVSQVQTAVVGCVDVVLGTFWVWMFFGENFSALGWLGSVLVIAAVILMVTEKKRSKAEAR